MSRKKDTHELIQLAESQGWEVTSSRRRGHIRFKSPSGEVVIAAATPGSARSKLNTLARLRKAGMVTPRKGG